MTEAPAQNVDKLCCLRVLLAAADVVVTLYSSKVCMTDDIPASHAS